LTIQQRALPAPLRPTSEHVAGIDLQAEIVEHARPPAGERHAAKLIAAPGIGATVARFVADQSASVVRTFRSAVSGRPEGLHYTRSENAPRRWRLQAT
jgi:hypothetical protein